MMMIQKVNKVFRRLSCPFNNLFISFVKTKERSPNSPRAVL